MSRVRGRDLRLHFANHVCDPSPSLTVVRSSLEALLATGRVVLADGATGTNYFAMGLEAGEPPELWNAEHPDRVQELHRAFVEAGSRITGDLGHGRAIATEAALDDRFVIVEDGPGVTPLRPWPRRAPGRSAGTPSRAAASTLAGAQAVS